VECISVGIFFFLGAGNIAFDLWVVFLFGLLGLHWWEGRTLSKYMRLRPIQDTLVVGQVVWLNRCHLVNHLSILWNLTLTVSVDSTVVICGLVELLGHLDWLLRHGWHLDHTWPLIHSSCLLLWLMLINFTGAKLRLLVLLLLLLLAHL